MPILEGERAGSSGADPAETEGTQEVIARGDVAYVTVLPTPPPPPTSVSISDIVPLCNTFSKTKL